jgi:hypothetical protein
LTANLLAEKTRLRDVANVEGFAAAALDRVIRKHALAIDAEERAELLAEGIAILYELANRYEARRPGYAREGSFAGYAAVMLPKRLADAWHAMHPEHRRISTEQGRRWSYGQPPVALEDAGPLAALDAAAESARSEVDRLDEALALIPAWERFAIRAMIDLAGEGRTASEIALKLSVSPKVLGQMREHLGNALARAEELAL